MADGAAICGYCGAPLRELVNGACSFCRTPVPSGGGVAGAPPISGCGVVLHPAGKKKINVIKAVRTVTGMDLRGAKELVEAADGGPALIAQGLSRDAAQSFVDEIARAGGQAEVRD